jgi:MFS transporter, DHA1 family, tetracycline resistance protein
VSVASRRGGHGRGGFFLTPLGIVFTTVVIDLIGFGIAIPILPIYAKDLGASAFHIGALASVYSLMQFLFAPVWGRLSDRHGRRPVILVALAGTAISSLFIGLASSLVFLWIARILNGISGASYSAAQAYVADVTSREERAKGMGLIGAAFGIGFILGPAIGGLCAIVSSRLPFFVAAGVAALNLLIAYRRLPEPERHVRERMPQRELLRMALRDGRVAPMLAITFLGTFAFVGMEQTFALLGEARFDFGLVETGLVFTYIGIIVAVVQGKAIGPLVARFGERPVMLAGIVLTGASLGLLAVTTRLWALFPVMALLAASGLVFPTVTSMVSKAVGEADQGGMLGLLASSSGIARVLGPLAAGALFDIDVPLPYIVGAALFAVCLAIALRRPAAVALEPV